MADELVFLYADGFNNQKENTAPPLEYGVKWLEGVGIQNGPPPPTQKKSFSTASQHEIDPENGFLYPFRFIILFPLLALLAVAWWKIERKFVPRRLKSGYFTNKKQPFLDGTPETVISHSSSYDSLEFLPLKKNYGSL